MKEAEHVNTNLKETYMIFAQDLESAIKNLNTLPS
jgi:hypothetical protein